LELGDRTIILLPIPGHTDDDLGFYDPVSQFVVTGDTVYPGRLYVRNWSSYRASIARLNTWIQEKPVSHVLGTHIEMTAEANVDYPIGTTYQPDEHPLPLAPSAVLKLHETLMSLEVPERTYLGSFIIWPVE
ncbi:MAG: MBL fold metallo-hydrolase, partial [Pseudohongiella sp.]|nr:MBL fold metallo-hydrolase [Pseudohongiella sp.]